MGILNFASNAFLNRNLGKYKIISDVDLLGLHEKYSDVWKDKTIPQKQWSRVEMQLQHVDDIPEFRAVVDCIKGIRLKNPLILEIGCSSGYLSEVLKKSGIKARYEGTDYSPSFIQFARQKYSDIKFTVNDATRLRYERRSFDIVISGCCLLHIIDYKKAISETARVAKKFVIFHRTPVLHAAQTSFLTKTAYGKQMLDIYFNEEELINLFYKDGLAVIKIIIISREYIPVLKEDVVVKNYVCRRIS